MSSVLQHCVHANCLNRIMVCRWWCVPISDSTVQFSTVQYSTVQFSSVQYSTVQYSTVQYSTVQYSIVQYSTVQYSSLQLISPVKRLSISIPIKHANNHWARLCSVTEIRLVRGPYKMNWQAVYLRPQVYCVQVTWHKVVTYKCSVSYVSAPVVTVTALSKR
jgi:beta-xylosidase